MTMKRAQGASRRAWAAIIALLWLCISAPSSTAAEEAFTQQLSALQAGDFAEKEAAVHALEALDDERVLPLLKALLAGDLHYLKGSGRVVFAKETDGGYRLTDPMSGEALGKADRRELKKITINNALRGQLRGAIARRSLSHKNAAVRLQAVQEIIKDIDADGAAVMRDALQREDDDDVRAAMRTAIAMTEIASEDKATRLRAVSDLGESLLPEARQRLQSLLKRDAEGHDVESDREVRQAAMQAVAKIDGRRQLFGLMEIVFFGFSLGSVLLLAAIGLAITFGVMGVINMAHGELIMLGAYTTYVVQLLMPDHIGYSLLVAVPAAFVVSGVVGIAIERGVIRYLYGRPLETLLATFGISLVLQQAVRTIFSPLNRSVEPPAWMSGSWEINAALSLTYNRLYIIIFSLLVFAALLVILKKTSLGLQLRAVAQNRNMAKAMGIRSDWIDAMTFGLGSGIAGVAGVALSQLTNVGPNLGQAYIIDSFMVVVFGGVGNLWGTLVGALSLGVVNKFLEPWSGAVLAKILVLVFIILFIQKRPRGLFPQKGRAAED